MTGAVCVLGPAEDAEYERFLDRVGQRSPSVLAYHYPFYRDLLVDLGVGEPLYFGWRGPAGELKAVLPGFHKAAPAGTVYNSLPFFGPNGGVLAREEDATYEALLLRAVTERLRAEDYLCAAYRSPFLGRLAVYDEVLPEALVVKKFTQHLDISDYSPTSKIAYDLRKARRLGVSVEAGVVAGEVDALWEIYTQNCAAAGIPLKPRSAVERLCGDDFRGRVRAYSARREGELIGGLIVLHGPQTVSYYLPATRSSDRSLQPGSVLIDQALQDARKAGRRFWNWESSPDRTGGVHRFKAKWGSTESEYRTYVQPFADSAAFEQLGQAGLSASFPHFFVYPFERL